MSDLRNKNGYKLIPLVLLQERHDPYTFYTVNEEIVAYSKTKLTVSIMNIII